MAVLGDHRVRNAFIFALVVIALSSFALPIAEDRFWFGGHGFGTTLAQVLVWFAWRIVAKATDNYVTTSIAAVTTVQLLLNLALFMSLAAAMLLLARRVSMSRQVQLLVGLTLLYLAALFIFPQATVGP